MVKQKTLPLKIKEFGVTISKNLPSESLNRNNPNFVGRNLTETRNINTQI